MSPPCCTLSYIYLLNINTDEYKVDTAKPKLGQNEEEIDYDPVV